MKRLLFGFTLLVSMSSFAMNSTDARNYASSFFDDNQDVQEMIVQYKNNLGNASKKTDVKLISLKRDSGKKNALQEYLFSVRREVYDNQFLEQNSVFGFVYLKVIGDNILKSKVILYNLEDVMDDISYEKVFIND